MAMGIHVRLIGGLVLLMARANHATVTTLHHLAATVAGMRIVIVTVVVAAQDATTVGAPGSFVASRVLPWTARGSARGRAMASAMTRPGGVTTSTAISSFVMPEARRWLRHILAVTLHFTRVRDPRRDVDAAACAVPPVLLSGVAVQRPPRHPARPRFPLGACSPGIRSSRGGGNDGSPRPAMKVVALPKGRYRVGCVYRRRPRLVTKDQVGPVPGAAAGDNNLAVWDGSRMNFADSVSLIPVQRAVKSILDSLPTCPAMQLLPLVQSEEDHVLLGSPCSTVAAGYNAEAATDSNIGAFSRTTAVVSEPSADVAAVSTNTQSHLLNTIFTKPSPAILDRPLLLPTERVTTPVTTLSTVPAAPARRIKQRHDFNLSMVRRSARLANGPRTTAMQRAQCILCRKLGLLANDDATDFNTALQEFQDWFKKPLTVEMGTALDALFSLDKPDTVRLDKALMGIARDAIAEIQEEVDAMHAEARAVAAV
jgi:hypothetical protein